MPRGTKRKSDAGRKGGKKYKKYSNKGVRYAGYPRRRFAEEKKYVDVTTATYAINTTGSVTLLNGVAQGASESQRIGRNIRMRSLTMKGMVSADTTTLVASGQVLLVWDRQPNKAAPAVTDVLNAITSTSMNNDQNKRRFRVLRRWPIVVEGNVTTAGQQTGKTTYPLDCYVKFKKPWKFESSYAGATGGIGDIVNGALFMVTAGDVAAGTADISYTAAFRTRFVE